LKDHFHFLSNSNSAGPSSIPCMGV
jgi:hypothetical protein